MNSTNDGDGKQIPLSLRRASRGSSFARNDKTDVGAPGWGAGGAVLARMGIARIGVIELMFLFAPLVIVPLGMELGRVGGFESGVARRLASAAQILQPLGAVLAVGAGCLPPGERAGIP